MNLDRLTLRSIFKSTETEEKAISFAQQLGLLRKPTDCDCGEEMRLVVCFFRNFSFAWYRCTNCMKKISVRKGSFFEKSILPIRTVICLIYFYCRNISNFRNLRHEFGEISWKTLKKTLSLIHEVCMKFLQMNPTQLGGEGHYVDFEKCLVRKKFLVDKFGPHFRLLMIHDRNTGLCNFIRISDKKSADKFISSNVLPGSIIVKDRHEYFNLENMCYSYLSDNNSKDVDPMICGTIIHVKSVFRQLKKLIRRKNDPCEIDRQIFSFMWKQRFGKSLDKFVEHVKLIYKVE